MWLISNVSVKNMAFTFNGIGTMFCGQREFRKDGTYITTEWIVLCYVPIVPIRSIRVKYLGPGAHRWYLGMGSCKQYTVYDQRLPNWK